MFIILRFARFCSCLQSLAAGEVSVLSSTSGSLKFADLNQGQSLAWWTSPCKTSSLPYPTELDLNQGQSLGEHGPAKRHLCPTPQKWSKVKVKVLVNIVVMIRHRIWELVATREWKSYCMPAWLIGILFNTFVYKYTSIQYISQIDMTRSQML